MTKKTKKKTLGKTKRKTLRKTKRKILRKTNIKEIATDKELIFKTKPEWVKAALVNKTQYQKKYTESIKNNNEFWKKEGRRITWIKPYKKIKNVKYSKTDVQIKW